MSTLAVIFDPHFWPHKRHGGPLVKGINRRAELCLDIGQHAVGVANAHQAPLIVAGDLIDSAGPVAPQFAFALRETLAECRQPVTLMLGNHDMTADGDHSLGIYTQCDDWRDVRVYEDFDIDYQRVCLVPFHRDIRDKRVRDVPLVIAHFGVYDDSFPAWCRKAKGAWHVDALFAFMQERNIKAICLGDWHSRRLWMDGERQKDALSFGPVQVGTDAEHMILQGGALCPTGFDNQGLHGYGTVAFWDGERLSWEELPGPRFCTVRSDEEEKAVVAEAAKLGHNLFLRRYYTGDRPETPPGLEAYEALPVAVEQAAVKRLAYVTSNATYVSPQTRLDELVSHWLDTIAPGDERAAVQEILRRYL